MHVDGRPWFVRVASGLGGEMLTRVVMEQTGRSRDQAEELKRTPGALPAVGQPARSLEESVLLEATGRLLAEVRTTLDFHAGHDPATAPRRVVLTGGGALLPGLVEHGRAAWGLPVRLHAPDASPAGAVSHRPVPRGRGMSGLLTRPLGRHVEEPAEAPAQPAAYVGRTSVNLLSPWVREGLRVRALRKRFTYALLALVVAAGGAWAFHQLLLREASAELRGEQAVGTALQDRIADLSPVSGYVADVRTRSQEVRDTMWTEVSHARVLDTLVGLAPAGTTFESTTLALPVPGAVDPAATTPDPAAAESAAEGAEAVDPEDDPARGLAATCPGPDPFATETVVACLELTGTAPSRRVVADLVQALAAEKLFVEPFITTTTTDEAATVSFTGSVGVDPRAFTGRYDDLLERLDPAEGDDETEGAQQ